MPVDMLAGLGAALAVLLVPLALRFIVALVRSDGDSPVRSAFMKTGKWSLGIAGAIGSATALGVVEFWEVVASAVGFVAAHPFIASNVGSIGLGAGALSGVVSLSPAQFVGIALGIVGLVFVVVEVDNA